MLSTSEQRELDEIGERLGQDDPRLAALLRPQALQQKQHGWSILSWIVLYLVLLPWVALALVIYIPVAVAMAVAPIVVGLLVGTWRLSRRVVHHFR